MRRVLMIVFFISHVLAVPGILAQTQTPIEPQRLEQNAADGLALVGDFYALVEVTEENPAPAVLLLHMLGSDRGAWEPLIPALIEGGYHVLAVDMRGHGETGGSRNWTAAEADTQLWLNWLKAQPEISSASIVGASIGSNMALIGCANDADCVTAVALSPGLDYAGVQPESAVVVGLAQRSALLVAAHGDGNSPAAVQQMAGNAVNEIGTRIFPGRAHGTNMFSADYSERVIAMIVNWMDEQIRFAVSD